MQKQQVLGKMETDKTDVEGGFPYIYHLQIWYPKFLLSKSLQLFSGKVCRFHRAVKRMQDWTQKAAGLLYWNHLQSNKVGNDTWVRGGKKNSSTFLTINEGFLMLQHLLRDSAMLILRQAVFSPSSHFIGKGSRAYGQGREASLLSLLSECAASLSPCPLPLLF